MYPNNIIVDYDVLKENFKKLQSLEPKTSLVTVIKSNAYGHGAVECARIFASAGAAALAVFRLEEAIELRRNGITAPVWVLLGALPSEASLAVQYDFTLVCYSLEQAVALSKVATKDVILHLAVDTGMGRLGFLPEELMKNLEVIRQMPHLKVKGICAHIANADRPDHPVTIRQVETFRALLKQLPAECTENHSCASNAWLNHLIPELHFARPGICLYTNFALSNGQTTENAMRFSSSIVSLKRIPKGNSISYNSVRTLDRDSLVAIAPMGYDDGYLRSLSNQSCALVHGQRVPLLGTICMSMCMFDVTDVANVQTGDEIVLFGKQGEEEITVTELAELAHTTTHEILCAVGKNARKGIYR